MSKRIELVTYQQKITVYKALGMFELDFPAFGKAAIDLSSEPKAIIYLNITVDGEMNTFQDPLMKMKWHRRFIGMRRISDSQIVVEYRIHPNEAIECQRPTEWGKCGGC